MFALSGCAGPRMSEPDVDATQLSDDGFQAYLAEDGWLIDNLRLPMAAVVSALTWIVSISMMSLAISAWVKWKVIARLFLFGSIFIGAALGQVIHELFGGWIGKVINLFESVEVLIMSLYGVGGAYGMPGWAAAMVFIVITFVSSVLVTRRIRAFEVVS